MILFLFSFSNYNNFRHIQTGATVSLICTETEPNISSRRIKDPSSRKGPCQEGDIDSVQGKYVKVAKKGSMDRMGRTACASIVRSEGGRREKGGENGKCALHCC